MTLHACSCFAKQSKVRSRRIEVKQSAIRANRGQAKCNQGKLRSSKAKQSAIEANRGKVKCNLGESRSSNATQIGIAVNELVHQLGCNHQPQVPATVPDCNFQCRAGTRAWLCHEESEVQNSPEEQNQYVGYVLCIHHDAGSRKFPQLCLIAILPC